LQPVWTIASPSDRQYGAVSREHAFEQADAALTPSAKVSTAYIANAGCSITIRGARSSGKRHDPFGIPSRHIREMGVMRITS
jgi:hypothetical protein